MCPMARDASSCQSWCSSPLASRCGRWDSALLTMSFRSPTVVHVLKDMQATASAMVASTTTYRLSIDRASPLGLQPAPGDTFEHIMAHHVVHGCDRTVLHPYVSARTTRAIVVSVLCYVVPLRRLVPVSSRSHPACFLTDTPLSTYERRHVQALGCSQTRQCSSGAHSKQPWHVAYVSSLLRGHLRHAEYRNRCAIRDFPAGCKLTKLQQGAHLYPVCRLVDPR